MAKSSKTIAIFSGYQLPHLGGVENYTNNLSHELVKKGYRVIIVSSDYTFSGIISSEEGNIKKVFVPVHKLFVSRYPIPKKNKKYRLAITELDKEKIDYIIVNTRFYLTTLIGAKYGKKHNIPVYLVEHGSQHLTVNNKFLDYMGAHYEHFLTRIVKRYVNYNYGVSKAACEWQKHFGIISDGIWYNSINDFTNLVKNKRKDDGIINITYVGRVIQQKGLERLCNTFVKLQQKYNNIKLTIVGDGDYLLYLKTNFVDKNIVFTGKLDFEEIIDIYNYTDIFVYAPIWPEGLPTSILEAGLMDCAVVASPQGGIKEVIEDEENGIMIENEQELYDALKKLIDEPKLRANLSKKLKDKVSREFVWSETVNTILKNINE